MDAIDAILAQARRIRSDSKRVVRAGSVATSTATAASVNSKSSPHAAHKTTTKATAQASSASAVAAAASTAPASAAPGVAPTRASRRWGVPTAFHKEITRHVGSPDSLPRAVPTAASTPLGGDAQLAFDAALRSHGARQYTSSHSHAASTSTSTSASTSAAAATTPAAPHAVRQARLVATIQSQLWVLHSLRTTLPWAALRDPTTPTPSLAVYASLLAGTLRCVLRGPLLSRDTAGVFCS